MPFNFSGVIRKAQWLAFRRFSLRERQALASRIRAINSELDKIGRITVIYEPIQSISIDSRTGAETQVMNVSEKRRGFLVTVGSSLEKLIQAYIAQGGNPASISLFLQPDQLQMTTDLDPDEDSEYDPNQILTSNGIAGFPFDQPYGGIVAPKSTDSYGVGGRYQGGLPTFIRDPFSKIGRFVDLSDSSSKIAIKMDHAKRWIRQEIKELASLEAKIMKLVDLREQLMKERDDILQQAVGGSVSSFPEVPDSERFALNLHLTRIVSEMDRTFFQTTESGEPNFDSIHFGTKESPEGISNYDTLFDDDMGEDPFAV